MTFRRSLLSLAFGAFASFGIISDSRADVLLNFAENSGSAVSATFANGAHTQTTIQGNDIQVTVTNIAPEAGLPGSQIEYLTFNLTSTAPADNTLYGLGVFAQSFQGSFSIRSATGGGGYNLLSGNSIGAIISGSLTGANVLNFQSNNNTSYDFNSGKNLQLPYYTFPTGLSFSFANVTGAANAHTGNTTGSGVNTHHTLNPFTASVSGVISATPIPEPSTLALLGLGGIGMAFGAYRRRRAIAA